MTFRPQTDRGDILQVADFFFSLSFGGIFTRKSHRRVLFFLRRRLRDLLGHVFMVGTTVPRGWNASRHEPIVPRRYALNNEGQHLGTLLLWQGGEDLIFSRAYGRRFVEMNQRGMSALGNGFYSSSLNYTRCMFYLLQWVLQNVTKAGLIHGLSLNSLSEPRLAGAKNWLSLYLYECWDAITFRLTDPRCLHLARSERR